MEFFHEPKINWMEIKWYFIALSLALARDWDWLDGGSQRAWNTASISAVAPWWM